LKIADMLDRGYPEDKIIEFISSGIFKRGYLSKIDRWNEAYIEYMFKPEEDIEYNAWGRKIALWFQDIASTAKSFWASQNSVISHTIGATLSDFGGGAGQFFNLGTKTGESIVQYERSKDFETLLIMSTTIWGETGEAFLATYGGLKGYHRLKGKAPTQPPTTSNVEMKPVVIGENMKRVREYADEIGGHTYRPRKNKPFDFDHALKRQKQWIKNIKRQGRTIIDIGPDFGRRRLGRDPSPFYKIERIAIKGYEKYKKVFKRKGKKFGGVEGLD
ncbi:MAG: hypothetical protein ACFFG0_43260, partial [Candidatus Thorarchaeota archaeon]